MNLSRAIILAFFMANALLTLAQQAPQSKRPLPTGSYRITRAEAGAGLPF